MSPRALALLVFGFLSAVVLGFFLLRVQPAEAPERERPEAAAPTLTQPTVTFVDPARGAAQPTVTIVEFSDFTCTHCRDLAVSLVAALRRYPGEVRHVWKHFPNPNLHALSVDSAVAAQCAAVQGKFWEYHDRLFDRQAFLTAEQFGLIAAEVGIDETRFTACLESQETLPIVERDVEEAKGLGLDGTPTLFINGKRHDGAVSLEQLMQYVDEARLGR